MLKHVLLPTEGILILEPSSPLVTADFDEAANEIDSYLEQHGALTGVLIVAGAFPGWQNLEDAIADLELIENYHHRIKKLAIVSDNGLLEQLPKFAAHPLNPEVKHFSESEYEDALQWLREVPVPVGHS